MQVLFADAAIDDLRRLGPRLARRALEQVGLLGGETEIGETEAGDPLAGRPGPYRKLTRRDGAWRVVFEPDGEIATIWAIWVDGVRSNGAAYAEALHRMQSADTPDAVELAGILERLGRVTGTVPVPRNRVRDPVPDWLADALVGAGLTRLEVAAMDAVTAFDRWNSLAVRPSEA